jgi:septal ring factor EnvC (AmiA/AmiB activator)
MSNHRRTDPFRFAVVTTTVALLLALALTGSGTAAASPSVGQLQNQLGQQQARQHSLESSIGSLNGLIASLDSQISLVQSREAAVSEALAADRAQLARGRVSLANERIRLATLRRRLAEAKSILSRQLVSSYESTKPDLVSVVLDAHGFNDLLEQLNFLGRAEHQQQTIITITRAAKAQADAAAARLVQLQQRVRRVTAETELRARALAGMNELLGSKQSALARARVAQQDALTATRVRASDLHKQISRIRAAQAAAAARAAQAAAAAAQRAANATPVALGSTGGSGGWSIPYAIVLCESGGQNLPPNSAGASGYYQIIPGTWRLFGGTGPAAYLASKAEQDAVAARIWRGGAGASNWVCAGIVGIH